MSQPRQPWSALLPHDEERAKVWRQITAAVEHYIESVAERRVTPQLAVQDIRRALEKFDLVAAVNAADAIEFVVANLTEYQTHTPHPRYFGLFNPAPTMMGIAADTLVAAFNPQIAAWSHSPFAAEVERHTIRLLGEKFGYEPQDIDGAFCSGGAEANHTAVLTAVAARFPEFAEGGTRALEGEPVMYASAESHHSILKAARMSGLGARAVRSVPVDRRLRIRPDALAEAIECDLAAGRAPFLVVATAGTTNAGAIDPLPGCGSIARRFGLWFHVDAAWGGAAVMAEEMRPVLDGIEMADSITFDAHKWLSVPMGAGIYFTRHREAMDRAFRIQTTYMPREAANLDVTDPHQHTMQWSRRFTGLKVFLSLVVAGESGYANALRHQAAMGDLLRVKLVQRGWRIENETPLPVVCFSDPGGADPHQIAMRVVASGDAWISTTVLGGTKTVLRACITNYRTAPEDVAALVESLDRARGLARRADTEPRR